MLKHSPWARSWATEQVKGVTPTDTYGRALLVAILAMVMLLVGFQIGRKDGQADSIPAVRTEMMTKFGNDYAKVEWLLIEADLNAMRKQQ